MIRPIRNRILGVICMFGIVLAVLAVDSGLALGTWFLSVFLYSHHLWYLAVPFRILSGIWGIMWIAVACIGLFMVGKTAVKGKI